MLDTQEIDLQFQSGADTKTDDKNTLYTKFRELKNFRIDKIGAIVPRGGMNVIPSTYDVSGRAYDAFDLATTGTQTAYLADNRIFAVASGANNSVDVSPALKGAFNRLYGGDTFYNRLQVAASSTLICFAWGQYLTSDIGILIMDARNDEVLLQTTVGAVSFDNFQAVCVDDRFYLVLGSAALGMTAYLITTSVISPLTPVLWTGAPTGGTGFRWSAVGVADKLYIHHGDNANVTTSLNIATVTGSGSVFTSATTAAALTFAAAPTRLAITPCTSLSTVAVACFGLIESVTVRGSLFTNTGTRVGTELSETIPSAGSIKTWWAYEDTTASRPAVIGWQSLDTANGTVYTSHYSINTASDAFLEFSPSPKAFAACGPIMVDGRPIAILDSFTEGTYGSQAAVCTRTISNTVGTSLATLGVGANLGQFLYQIDRTLQMSSAVTCAGRYFFPVPMITALNGILAPDTTSSTLVYPTLSPKIQATLLILDPSHQSVSVFDTTNRQATYMGTQTRILETPDQVAGTWPEVTIVPNLDLSLVAGGLSGTISYTFAKLFRSSSGHEYRTYGPIYTATVLSKKLQYVLRTSTMVGCTGIEVYRTEANGTVFYRSNAALRTSAGTYTDDTTDADLVGGRLAEINGNELAPEAIPTARVACYYSNRLAVITADSLNEVWFNRPASFPSGTSFSTGLKLVVANEGGPLTAMKAMGSALYLFKNNSILVVYGEPPGLTGENGTLSEPKLLYDGVGCVAPRSLILTQNGLVFQSGKGFYILLSNNNQLQFIGSGPYDDRSVTVTGSAVLQSLSEVLFSFSNGSTWVLNTDVGAWYEWTTPSTVYGLAASGGNCFLAQNAGVLKYEVDETTDSEDGTTILPIAQDLTTGWVRLSGIAGYQRIKRLVLQMQVNSPCTVTVDVYTDYGSTSVQTVTIDTADLTSQNPAEVDIHLKVQKCEAMSFRIRTDQHGISLQGATLVVGVKSGTNKSRSAPNHY